VPVVEGRFIINIGYYISYYDMDILSSSVVLTYRYCSSVAPNSSCFSFLQQTPLLSSTTEMLVF
jgi:hypothetical protein